MKIGQILFVSSIAMMFIGGILLDCSLHFSGSVLLFVGLAIFIMWPVIEGMSEN